MRRLGRELGIEAMSLYGYVDSKEDLIEGVVEQVFRQMPLIVPGPAAGRTGSAATPRRTARCCSTTRTPCAWWPGGRSTPRASPRSSSRRWPSCRRSASTWRRPTGCSA